MKNHTDKATPTGGVRYARAKLVAILALFIGPLVGAFVWYYGLDARFAPVGQVNHAPLIDPPVPLGAFENPVYGGGSIARDSLAGQWTLVHAIGDTCGEDCRQFLYHTRQTRIALGRDTGRLQRFVLAADPALAETLRAEHPDAAWLRDDGNSLGLLLAPVYAAPGAQAADAVLVDPLGNAMMRIPAGLEPKLLLKDLKKLLKLSRIG